MRSYIIYSCVWLLLSNIMLLKFIHVVACSSSWFILIVVYYFVLWLHIVISEFLVVSHLLLQLVLL